MTHVPSADVKEPFLEFQVESIRACSVVRIEDRTRHLPRFLHDHSMSDERCHGQEIANAMHGYLNITEVAVPKELEVLNVEIRLDWPEHHMHRFTESPSRIEVITHKAILMIQKLNRSKADDFR